MGAFIDLTGQTFGRLVVISRASTRVTSSGKRRTVWSCRCGCGTDTTVWAEKLRSGHTKSCGCLRRDVPLARVGPANPNWKGDDITYSNAHLRVRVAKGSARLHSCVDCGRDAEDWSYVGGCPRERVSDANDRSNGCVYSPDPDRYVARCKSCHALHDIDRRAA